ncbi:MAG: universal stress protein [Haloarculaceae archaeon]
MRYIVATDGSEESDAAVRYATRHALAFDATLEIVHVLEPKTELVGGEVVLPGGEKATELGRRTLEAARGVATDVADADGGTEIETELLAGRPADAIADRARETEADAIFVGHRGLSEERERVVGSVAKNVVDKATVPVTVIR